MKKILQIAIPVVVGALLVIAAILLILKNSNKAVPEKPVEEPVFPVVSNAIETVNYDAMIAELENEINTVISDTPGNWSVYVKNLETGMSLEINNQEFVAASVIKLYNMITLYDELEKGNVEMTNSLQRNLEQMITVSSNSASNAVVTEIGGGSFSEGAKKVTDLATELGCTNTYEQHMLYDNYAPSTGKNRTSVVDCGIVLEKIYLQQCITPEYDTQMLELLKQQTRDFKIPANLPEDTVVANKTGENSKVEADVGIVFSPECDYIICISVGDYGSRKPRDIIADVSECVYNFFNNKPKEI